MFKLKGWVRNSAFLALLVIVTTIAIAAFVRQETMIKTMKDEISQKNSELGDVKLEVEGYERMLEYTQSNEYAEQQARSILGWVRDDEILFVDPGNNTQMSDFYDAGIDESVNDSQNSEPETAVEDVQYE